MALTSVEVRQRQPIQFAPPQNLTSLPEQKKAALRRVEMELDEADEMVRTVFQGFPLFTIYVNSYRF